MAGFVVINRKVVNFSSKTNSKANGHHYRKENKIKVPFLISAAFKSVFRLQQQQNGLFFLFWLNVNIKSFSKIHNKQLFERSKLPFSFFFDRFFVYEREFLLLYFFDKLTSQAGSLGEFVHEIMITDKGNVNLNFTVQSTLPLNFNLERDIFKILPQFFTVPLCSIAKLPAETCNKIKNSEEKTPSGNYWLCAKNSNMPVLTYTSYLLFFQNSSYVSGVSVFIFVALSLCMFGCLLQEPVRLKVL